MLGRIHRTGWIIGTVTVAAIVGLDRASGQTALPEITVDAPRQAAKRRPVRATTMRRPPPPSQRQPSTSPPAQLTVTPQTMPGIMLVVTDRFGPATTVSNSELRRNGAATLGDALGDRPGITSSSFAPGAASRPIVRGLDNNRVGIAENGLSSGGASDLGEDHFVPIDPFAATKVEVIRGPEALRYGSQSIGGVVNTSNNRIPEFMPCGAKPCAAIETRSAISSVDSGNENGFLIDAGGNNVAFHVDAYRRWSGDYAIPSSPYVNDPARPFTGRQLNSATLSEGASVGGSYFFAGGFVGAAITHTHNLYRIPGSEGEEFGTRIDGVQTKFTSKGEYRPDAAMIEKIRFWVGVTDYSHREIGRADANDPASDGTRQIFTNREQEGRIEVELAPFDLRFARLTSTLGAQLSHQELTTPSPDDPGAQFNGLWDPNNNTRVAGYMFHEFRFSPVTRAQLSARIEHVALNGAMPDFPPDYVPDGIGRPTLGRHRTFTPASVGVGLIQNLPWDLVGSVTAQYVERAPKPAELFSRGVHDATATFDIGNPNLKIEAAQTIEASLRRATGPLRFELSAYATRFNGFIFRNLTGLRCDEDFASCGNPNGELRQAVYAQRDALFRGAEFKFQYDALPLWTGMVGIEGQYDIVRATFIDGTNLPRIPPQRLGGGLYYRDANWLARISLLHAFAQNNIAATETSTPGYNRLKAEVSYTQKLDRVVFGPKEVTLGILGDNLLNENIRNHVSYSKDEVLLPGLNVRAFANLKF